MEIRLKKFCMVLLVLSCMASTSFAEEIRLPVLPASAATPGSFVPHGWSILAQATGDLNGDARPDTVIVLKHNHENDVVREEVPRPLLILFAQDGGYQLSARSDKLILCRTCGGAFGDPFEAITIAKRVLVISHYGGSRGRWAYTHRLRWQDSGWYLIGRTETQSETLSQRLYKIDANLLTGETIVETVDEEGHRKRSHHKETGKPLLPLDRLDLLSAP